MLSGWGDERRDEGGVPPDAQERRDAVGPWAREEHGDEALHGGVCVGGYTEQVGCPSCTVGVVGHHRWELLCYDGVEREGEAEDTCEVGGEGFVLDV